MTGIGHLRETVLSDKEMSDYRKAHILGVEKTAVTLGALYAPGSVDALRAAALLHDITKELPYESQLELCRGHGFEPPSELCFSPQVLHAVTAALVIPDRFPEYATPEIIGAVRWHTTGRAGMTLSEKLIYLADYIDETRGFDDCVALRRAFFDAQPGNMDMPARLAHLTNILIMSFRMTVSALVGQSKPVCSDTVSAYNYLIYSKERY